MRVRLQKMTDQKALADFQKRYKLDGFLEKNKFEIETAFSKDL